MLSTCFHNSKILTLLKLLMSIAFGQNRLDFTLKIERLLSSQAIYVAWQQSHACINFAYNTNLQLVWFIKSHFTPDRSYNAWFEPLTQHVSWIWLITFNSIKLKFWAVKALMKGSLLLEIIVDLLSNFYYDTSFFKNEDSRAKSK